MLPAKMLSWPHFSWPTLYIKSQVPYRQIHLGQVITRSGVTLHTPTLSQSLSSETCFTDSWITRWTTGDTYTQI